MGAITTKIFLESVPATPNRSIRRTAVTAISVISDDLLQKLGVAGTPPEARDQLEQWEALDALHVATVMFPVQADREDILATTDALAPTPS